MIFYIENPKVCLRKLLEPRVSSTVSHQYKNPSLLLYTMNVQIKTKTIKSTIYNNSKNDEILRCKCDKYVHDMYAEDFKT